MKVLFFTTMVTNLPAGRHGFSQSSRRILCELRACLCVPCGSLFHSVCESKKRNWLHIIGLCYCKSVPFGGFSKATLLEDVIFTFTNYQLPTTNYQLPTTKYQLYLYHSHIKLFFNRSMIGRFNSHRNNFTGIQWIDDSICPQSGGCIIG